MSSEQPGRDPRGNDRVPTSYLEDAFWRDGLSQFKRGNASEDGEAYVKKLEKLLRLNPGSQTGLSSIEGSGSAVDKESLEKFLLALKKAQEYVESLIKRHE